MSLAERVYASLREDILHGAILPGTRFSETQIAERFQISRTPVREAVARLRNEGLISDAPGGGLLVTNTSLADVREIYGLRRVLETYAIEEAFDVMEDIDFLQLEFFVQEARFYLEKGDITKIFEINTKFHDAILAKAENERLKHILEQLTDSILRYRIASLHVPGNAQKAIERHEHLVRALRERNLERAKQLIQRDVEAGRETLEALFRKGDGKGPLTDIASLAGTPSVETR